MAGADDKKYTLGTKALEQIREVVRAYLMAPDRLTDQRRGPRQVFPYPKMVLVSEDVAPGATTTAQILDDAGDETDETVEVKNLYRNTTIDADTVWWVQWFRGGWKFQNGECPE